MIDFILRPIRRNFGKDKRFYAAVDDMFGFIPNNIELYKLALIHKSASVVLADGQHINNERLEFLGDAVLECVSSDCLFIEYPDKNEGFLTKLRSKMVSRQMLNDVAKRIGLDQYVITHSSNNVSQKHIYGDAFEAMMGAIYLDQGYDFVNRLLINKIFVDYIKVDQLTQAETDFKSRLIEWCQKNHHTIHFDTVNDKTYSSTHPFFYSKVLIDNIEMGYGAGESKKEAEQRAAYSVSQGFSDEDCTKLLDKLDLLDAKSRAHSMRQYKDAEAAPAVAQPIESAPEQKEAAKSNPKPEQKEVAKAEPKSEQKMATKAEPKSESKSEQKSESDREPKADSKPKADPKPKAKPKSKAKPEAESRPAAETESLAVADMADTIEVANEVNEADVPAEVVVKRPRRRTSSKGRNVKSKSAENQVVDADNAPLEQKVAAGEAEAAAPKAKRSVRRRPKKSESSAHTAAQPATQPEQ